MEFLIIQPIITLEYFWTTHIIALHETHYLNKNSWIFSPENTVMMKEVNILWNIQVSKEEYLFLFDFA